MIAWHERFKRVPKEQRTADGIVFDSKGEMKRYYQLKLLQQIGQIKNLVMQVRHDLILPNGVPIKIGKRVCVYTSDFEYDERDGIHVIEDFKGFRDRESKFRIAVFEAITGDKVTIVERA